MKFLFDETYLLYNFILISVAAFSYAAEKLNKQAYRGLFRFFVFLVLFIPASLRYQTGTDYHNYVKIFNSPSLLANQEILWRYVNYFVIRNGLSVQWIFVIAAFLIYFPLCYALPRKYYCISMTLYILLSFYFKSYNILRQMIAVSFVLASISAFEKKKYLRSLIWYLISFCFHISVVLYLPVMIICQVKIKNKYLPTLIVLCGILFMMKFNVLKIVLNILVKLGSKYAIYQNIPKYLEKASIGTGLGMMIKLSFSLLVVVLYNRIYTAYPEKKVYLNFSIVFSLSYFLVAQFSILGRIRDLFILSPLLIAGYGPEQTGKYRKIALLCLLCVNILLFEKDLGSQTRDTYSNWIYPYYSIFYQGVIE